MSLGSMLDFLPPKGLRFQGSLLNIQGKEETLWQPTLMLQLYLYSKLKGCMK